MLIAKAVIKSDISDPRQTRVSYFSPQAVVDPPGPADLQRGEVPGDTPLNPRQHPLN